MSQEQHSQPLIFQYANANLKLVESVVLLAGVAAQENQRADQAEQDAAYDHLTGLRSPRNFEATISTLLAAHDRRQHEPDSLVYIDFDEFKTINDTHGHPIGDLALTHVAGLISSRLRKSDIAGRIGGDESAIYMPGTTESQALVAAHSLVELVSNSELAEIPEGITISVGVAQTTFLPDSLEALKDRADKALYFAKEHGRNQAAGYFTDVKAPANH